MDFLKENLLEVQLLRESVFTMQWSTETIHDSKPTGFDVKLDSTTMGGDTGISKYLNLTLGQASKFISRKPIEQLSQNDNNDCRSLHIMAFNLSESQLN